MVARALLVNSLGDSRPEEPKSYDIVDWSLDITQNLVHTFFHILKSTIQKIVNLIALEVSGERWGRGLKCRD